MKDIARHDKDTGSSEVQISNLTAKIENLIHELGNDYSIVIVTHSMQQAARVSKRTAYFHLGKLIEVGRTKDIFTRPQHNKTEAYISGKIG